MVIFPDTPGAYFHQLTSHPNVYDMGTMHNNMMKRRDHWTYPHHEQEVNTGPKQKSRVLLIANQAGMNLHMQPHPWEAFIQAIKLAHPNRLAIPTPTPPPQRPQQQPLQGPQGVL